MSRLLDFGVSLALYWPCVKPLIFSLPCIVRGYPNVVSTQEEWRGFLYRALHYEALCVRSCGLNLNLVQIKTWSAPTCTRLGHPMVIFSRSTWLNTQYLIMLRGSILLVISCSITHVISPPPYPNAHKVLIQLRGSNHLWIHEIHHLLIKFCVKLFLTKSTGRGE